VAFLAFLYTYYTIKKYLIYLIFKSFVNAGFSVLRRRWEIRDKGERDFGPRRVNTCRGLFY
jgi:hypothetical protein